MIAGTTKSYEGGSQPKDPDRALDPELKEDPDTFVELIDRTFYQLSYDGALVAIIANYPSLLPVSHVSKTGVPTSKKDPLSAPYPPHMYAFYREGHRDAALNPR